MSNLFKAWTSGSISGIMVTMIDEKCQVMGNEEIASDRFLIQLNSPVISGSAQPGHFVMVQAKPNIHEPLLRRPLAILKADPPYLWLYYQRIGKGTMVLSESPIGSFINLLGPLGNPFASWKNRKILLIAGGRGIVPMLFLGNVQGWQNQIYLAFGGRKKEDLLIIKKNKSHHFRQVYFYTEEGSQGEKGLVTKDLSDIMEKNNIDISISCGPEGMLKAVSKIVIGRPGEHYASLEALMGCGFGICQSCIIPIKRGQYKKVCTDGPIFKMEEIDWQTLR